MAQRGWALLFYTRTAQWWRRRGRLALQVMAAAVAGLWIALRQRTARASLLLWVPPAFYVYSVAYGSVPIFIPRALSALVLQRAVRMEMLPALALFASWPRRRGSGGLRSTAFDREMRSRPMPVRGF